MTTRPEGTRFSATEAVAANTIPVNSSALDKARRQRVDCNDITVPRNFPRPKSDRYFVFLMIVLPLPVNRRMPSRA
jgi:hypothetical protein